MKKDTSKIGMTNFLIIVFSGGHKAQDLAIEVNFTTGYMIMPIYRMN
jgi:hypothetical protein